MKHNFVIPPTPAVVTSSGSIWLLYYTIYITLPDTMAFGQRDIAL